jgi:hypothetical protein
MSIDINPFMNRITGLTFPISAQLQHYFLTNFFIYTCTFSFALFVPSLFLAMGDFCSSAAMVNTNINIL